MAKATGGFVVVAIWAAAAGVVIFVVFFAATLGVLMARAAMGGG